MITARKSRDSRDFDVCDTTVSGEYTSRRRVRSAQRIKITDSRALFVGLRAGESAKDVAVARTTLAAAALVCAAKTLNLDPQGGDDADATAQIARCCFFRQKKTPGRS